MKKLILLLVTPMMVSLSGFGQVLDPGESPLDGVYSKSEDNPNRDPIPYVQLREADLMWVKRVWRIVDMEEKMNHVFYYPEKPSQGRKSFMYIIKEALTESGNITAYSAEDEEGFATDMFDIPMTPEEVDSVAFSYTVNVQKEVDGVFEDVEETQTIDLNEIKKFMIKEEVFFDNERSVLEFRILGIAPMVPSYNPQSELEAVIPGFWIYFPEARSVFAQEEVYNRHNDVHRMTYDDLFWKRMFDSRIVKESNVHDRKLEEYLSPLDALLEAEKIEDEIFHFEHDLWSF